MVNSHNLCFFEGRIAKDPEYTTVNTSNGQVEKVSFTLAVDRKLTSQQRQASRNGDQSIVTTDFVRCSLIGNAVPTFKQYCPKGKAITVSCTYATYQSTNNQTGQTQYGHIFNVEDFSFAVADAKNMVGGNNNQQQNNNNYGNGNNYNQNGNYGNGNNYNNQNNNNYGNGNNYNQNGNNYNNYNGNNQQNNGGDFQMFDNSNSASPF